MQFGGFYEHQLPKPWTRESEHKLFKNAMEQVELSDRLGYDYIWATEHHFLEEYAHSSAPEVFLAACAARTKNLRIGHGIVHMPTKINHPARVAERIATLDLLSNGRVDWGTGESATALELEGFNLANRKDSAIDYYYASQLKGESQPHDDIHFHPLEPRSFRLMLVKSF